MSDLLPKEGKTPPQKVDVEKPKAAAAVPAAQRSAVLTIGQFAQVRQLKDAVGGFQTHCLRRKAVGKFALAKWDELWEQYCQTPIRG